DASKAAFRGGPRERFVGEGIAHFGGLMTGIPKAIKAFARSMAGEGLVKGEVSPAPFEGKFGKVAGLPGRLLEASHQFCRQLSEEAEKHSLAWRDAMKSPETKTRGDVKAAYQKMLEVPDADLPPAVQRAMEKAADQNTYRERAGPVLKELMRLRNNVPF